MVSTNRPTSSPSTAPTAPDRANVTAQDGQIDISGLPADTQITGSETLDQLQVDTLDGNDTVNVAPDVSTLIGVAVDLGLGRH